MDEQYRFGDVVRMDALGSEAAVFLVTSPVETSGAGHPSILMPVKDLSTPGRDRTTIPLFCLSLIESMAPRLRDEP
jgi:hypothetical protein